MDNYILQANNIKKKYVGNNILTDVSIYITRGSIYGLVGKNGSGKTTLLRILTGLIKDFQGTVYIRKTNGYESKIATVINEPSLFLNMNAVENMIEQSYLLGLKNRNNIQNILKTVGLSDVNKKAVKNYSLGMIQRLKLAIALLQNPDILILDEPLNGLDPSGITDLRELLRDLNSGGMTILISSHILSELEQIATNFAILHDGRIAKEFSRQNIFNDFGSLENFYMYYTKGEDKWPNC